ncbi:hypothetical protein [Shewanella waksmanii]|uniref:hypothetical protein n=1 Tax=Shewanella waksmanii TaxID=213783 RepID=UPI003735417C
MWIRAAVYSLFMTALLYTNVSLAREVFVEYCEQCSQKQMESTLRAMFKYRNCPDNVAPEVCSQSGLREYTVFFSNASHTEVKKYLVDKGTYFMTFNQDELTNRERRGFAMLVEVRHDMIEVLEEVNAAQTEH